MNFLPFIGTLWLVTTTFGAEQQSPSSLTNPRGLPFFKGANGQLLVQVPSKDESGTYPQVIFLDPRQARPVVYSSPLDPTQGQVVYIQPHETESGPARQPQKLPDIRPNSPDLINYPEQSFLYKPLAKPPQSPIEQFLKEVAPTTKTNFDQTLHFRPPVQVPEQEKPPQRNEQPTTLTRTVFADQQSKNYQPQFRQLQQQYIQPQLVDPQYQFQINQPEGFHYQILQPQRNQLQPQSRLQQIPIASTTSNPLQIQLEPQQLRYQFETQSQLQSKRPAELEQVKEQRLQFLPRDSPILSYQQSGQSQTTPAPKNPVQFQYQFRPQQRQDQPPQQEIQYVPLYQQRPEEPSREMKESDLAKSSIYVSQHTELKKPNNLSPTEEPENDFRSRTPIRRSRPMTIQYQPLQTQIEESPQPQQFPYLQSSPQTPYELQQILQQPTNTKKLPPNYFAPNDQSQPRPFPIQENYNPYQQPPPHVIAISSVPPHFVRVQPFPHTPQEISVRPLKPESDDNEQLKQLLHQPQTEEPQPQPTPIRQPIRKRPTSRQQQKNKIRMRKVKPMPMAMMEETELTIQEDLPFALKPQATTYPKILQNRPKDRAVQIITDEDE